MWTANFSTKRQTTAAFCLAMAGVTITGCGFNISPASVARLNLFPADTFSPEPFGSGSSSVWPRDKRS
jgi:hypothetical protein